MRPVHALDSPDFSAGIARQAAVIRNLCSSRAHAIACGKARRRSDPPQAGRTGGQHAADLRSAQQARNGRRRPQHSGRGNLISVQQSALRQQFLQTLDPDRVVAELRIRGKRFARTAAHVDVPRSGRAHGHRERQRTALPIGMEQLTLRLRNDATVPDLSTKIGVRSIAHGRLPGAGTRPVPIMESRVTSAASCSSLR